MRAAYVVARSAPPPHIEVMRITRKGPQGKELSDAQGQTKDAVSAVHPRRAARL